MTRTAFCAHYSGRNVDMNWPQATLEAQSQLGVMQERHEGDNGDEQKWPHSRDMQEIESTEFSD